MWASRGWVSARTCSMASPPSPAPAGLGLTVTITGVGRQVPAGAERVRDALCRAAALARAGCGVSCAAPRALALCRRAARPVSCRRRLPPATTPTLRCRSGCGARGPVLVGPAAEGHWERVHRWLRCTTGARRRRMIQGDAAALDAAMHSALLEWAGDFMFKRRQSEAWISSRPAGLSF